MSKMLPSPNPAPNLVLREMESGLMRACRDVEKPAIRSLRLAPCRKIQQSGNPALDIVTFYK
jgi:hypothetical protein